MSSSMLSIGTSGLQAFQRSLTTVSHNIANANTDGYSRQTLDLSSRIPQAQGYGFVGSGVQAVTIQRSYDAFVTNNVLSSASSHSEFESFYTLSTQLDNVLGDPTTGMDASMQRFFDAMQDVADTPSSPAARQVLFDESKQLTEQFNELSSWMESLRGQVNSDLRISVGDINTLTQSIAQLNEAVVLETGRSGGQPPNDLLDQRDALINDLSKLVAVTTVEQDNGAVNVMVGSGQVLVTDNNATRLNVFVEPGGDPGRIGIGIDNGSGGLVPVTSQLTGGKIAGVIGFRDRMLDPTINSLGTVAVSMGTFLNEQNRDGIDIDGALGQDIFNIGQPTTLTLFGTPDNVSVTFDDVTQLTSKDYQLRFNAGLWDLTRTDTGQSVTMTGTGTAADPFLADGISIEIAAAPANGDTYLIRPTRSGALDMGVALGSSRQMATAAPVRSEAAVANLGSGTISAGEVTDISNIAFQTTAGQLTPPAMVRFTSGISYDLYDNTNPAAPVLLEAGIAYDPSTGGDVYPTPGGIDPGYQVHLSGAPVAGDEFSTEYNTGGTGDNRNALLMASVATNNLMQGGTASLNDSYIGLVADVGINTRQADLNTQTQAQLMGQAEASRQSISGVNLDEEAANLIRFQQAYQAAAQVISTAGVLFDSLLNAVRR